MYKICARLGNTFIQLFINDINMNLMIDRNLELNIFVHLIFYNKTFPRIRTYEHKVHYLNPGDLSHCSCSLQHSQYPINNCQN